MSYLPGIAPIGQIEPFNIAQKNALRKLALSGPKARGFMNLGEDALKKAYQLDGKFSSLNSYLQNSNNFINKASSSLSDNDFLSGYDRFYNPYVRDVINATRDDINHEGDIIRSQIAEQASAAGSFGGTRHGVREAELDKKLVDKIGKISSRLRSDGFNVASSNALEQYNQEMNRNLQAAGVSNQIANTGANILLNRMNSLRNLASSALQARTVNRNSFDNKYLSKLQAGDRIQNQNQKLLNILHPQIANKVNYQENNLLRLASMLNQIPIGGTGINQGPKSSPNYLGKTLGALGALSQSLGM